MVFLTNCLRQSWLNTVRVYVVSTRVLIIFWIPLSATISDTVSSDETIRLWIPSSDSKRTPACTFLSTSRTVFVASQTWSSFFQSINCWSAFITGTFAPLLILFLWWIVHTAATNVNWLINDDTTQVSIYLNRLYYTKGPSVTHNNICNNINKLVSIIASKHISH